MRHLLLALLIAPLALTACSRNMSSNTVTSSNAVAKVVYGTVVSSRQVTVKEADKLQDNALGGLAGGVAGGVAGSAVGGGTGRSLATVGGAIAGAVLGAAIQDELGTSSGTEYIVQLDQKSPANLAQRKRNRLDVGGGNSVKKDVNDSIQMADTESDAIAVVQQDEIVIAPGTRVMVVYSDDRPRVVPVNR
jgi:outer membrane lipoprotein SlyB